MKKLFYIMLPLMAIICLSACSERRDTINRTREVAKRSVSFGIGVPDGISVISVSMPDSVMGDALMTDEDLQSLLIASDQVTEMITEKTKSVDNLTDVDDYVMEYANLQIMANQQLPVLMTYPTDTSRFSAWRVKVFYEYPTSTGEKVKVVRFCYVSPDGSSVLKVIDFPLI